MPVQHFLRLAVAGLVFVAVAGCAATPSRSAGTSNVDARDPFEPLNRVAYDFNDAVDRALVRPVARGYRKITPQPLQNGFSNFFANAKYPVVVLNNLLQGKLATALADSARFLINTTVGVAGFGDPATRIGLDSHDEDFGQTLGRWGVPAGPYLVVPLFGPNTLRDAAGSLADDFLEPRHYLEDDSTRWTIWAADRLDKRVRLLDADVVLERAGDPYAFVRSAFLQRREFLVRDGNVPTEDTQLEDPEIEETRLEDRSRDAGPKAAPNPAPESAPAPQGVSAEPGTTPAR